MLSSGNDDNSLRVEGASVPFGEHALLFLVDVSDIFYFFLFRGG